MTAIDPGISLMLDAMAAGPGLDTMTPAEARLLMAALAAADGEPPAVAAVEDGEVAGVRVRRYRPEGTPTGTLAWFHGGGWVIGDLESAHPTAARLCAGAGCEVVSVDYRLAPEHPFPAAPDDCWAVTAALAADAGPGGLAVGGDSAGGNLAAVVAVQARDEGVALRHQVLVYPVTDSRMGHPSMVENGEGYFLTAASMRWFTDHYAAPEQRTDPRVSPLLTEHLQGVAAATVLTAGFDPLRDEGDAYAARLAEAGVDVEHRRFDSMIHGFFSMGSITPVAQEAIDLVCAALRRAFAA